MAEPLRIRKTGRRVQTEPAEGYLGEPPAVADDLTEGEDAGSSNEGNDERLLRDKPPHWG